MESIPSSTALMFGQSDNNVLVQPVHSSGLTRVVHPPSTKGKGVDRLFTAGDDYLVRILPAQVEANVESLIIDDATKPITWIDADADYLVAASEDGCVRIYQHTTPLNDDDVTATTSPTDLVCILARSSLAARCAALERSVAAQKTPRVAICSDDLVVKVVDAGDPSHVQLLTGHERGVRAASWCPSEPLLTTSSCEGTVKLWKLSTTEPECIKTFPHILSASSGDSELTAEAIWHPSGDYFVVPSKTHEIVIFGRDAEWRRIGALIAPEDCEVRAPAGDISSLAFCPNGRYLAVSTTDGQITVWDWAKRKPIRAKKSQALVTGISWNPAQDALAWADNAGQVARWKKVLGEGVPSSYEQVIFPNSHSGKSKAQDDEDLDDLFDEQGIEEETANADLDTDAVDRLDEHFASGVGARRSRRTGSRSVGPLMKAQTAFQPTSTPMRNARRYLAFNVIGSLVAIDQDSHQSISFETFDASARRNWRFIDQFGYHLASIGVHGALLACPERKGLDGDSERDEEDEGPKDKGHASNVYFKPFEVPGGWTVPGSEWSMDLPRGEQAVALAMAGRRSVQQSSLDNCTAVVATTAGYLRFFSGAGLQRYIWAFGSQVITMAAGNRFLLLVHRNSATSEQHQNMLYTLIDVSTLEKRQEGVLPLVEGATLAWAGFGEMDVPAIFDSRGVLFLLDRALAAPGQSRWIPALDTRTLNAKDGRSDEGIMRIRYWPVGLDGTSLLAVMLKGQSFPDASSTSRPLIQELQLHMPVADAQTPTGMLEEHILRQNQLAGFARSFKASLQPEEEEDEYFADLLEQPMAKAHALEHEADKAVLQLIQQACKSDKHQRALDAARELHSSRTLDAALQIATFFHLSSLVDRMGSLRGYVTDRRERDERILSALPFAPAEIHDSSRVLVASSPSPAVSGHNGSAAGMSAKQALARDFQSAAPSRSYGGSRSDLAKLGRSPSSTWASSAPKGHASTSQQAEKENGQSLLDGEEDDVDEQDDVHLDRSEGSPVPPKRRTPEDDAETDAGPASKRGKETLATSPFTNKTNRGFAKPQAAASSTAGKNPFARTAGMTRDRSMHKSNSFFDRVDLAASNSTSIGSNGAGRSGPTKTKQATLFGMTSGPRNTGSSGSLPASSALLPAATPAFGSESQETEGGETDESMRLTLSAAQQREAESQIRLEETQYSTEEHDDDSQRLEIDQASSTSIPVA